MHPDEYNRQELEAGRIMPEHVTMLASWYQAQRGLPVDGKLGPATRAALARDGRLVLDAEPGELGELRIKDGWLEGAGVQIVPAHKSWYYAREPFEPVGIMAHYTATGPNTAATMAKRRTKRRGLLGALGRKASWHLTIAQDGTLWQMVPLTRGAWHCRRGTVAGVDGQSVAINHAVIGIELEGYGDAFPAAQVEAACRLWRTLVQGLGIRRELVMLEHSHYDPDRRRDPGLVWMQHHAPHVLEHAFA